jgi:hypothetical protein
VWSIQQLARFWTVAFDSNENATGDASPSLLAEHAALDARLEVDASAMEAWRSSRLQPSHREPEVPDRLRQRARRRLAVPACRPLIAADVDQPVQKRPGGDDQRLARQTFAILELESNDVARRPSEYDRPWPRLSRHWGLYPSI